MKILTFFIQLLYAQQNSESEKQPNIVYILADDLGWADVNWNNKLGSHILGAISLSIFKSQDSSRPTDRSMDHCSEFVGLISWTRVR